MRHVITGRIATNLSTVQVVSVTPLNSSADVQAADPDFSIKEVFAIQVSPNIIL